VRDAVYRALLRRPVLRRGAPGEGTFALTFDDGPDPRFTPQVLDVLAARGAVATFFVVGAGARRHPDIVRRIVRDGHGLGSHTWSHPDLEGLPAARLLGECGRGRLAVERIARRRVRAYRPPKGHWDARGAAAARVLRLEPWLWTLDPADWRGDATRDGLLERLQGLAAGDVVLLHDGVQLPESPAALDRSATVAALPLLLDLAADRGLRAVRLDAAA
jgi:peptidoglycan/xylan/chitin deacetylase (PgdA/CDA1 family)